MTNDELLGLLPVFATANPSNGGSDFRHGESVHRRICPLAFVCPSREASGSDPMKTAATIEYPAKSCQRSVAEMLFVAAIQTRKDARQKFAALATPTAPITRAARRPIDSLFISPKSSPIMREVCNERTPLQASSTPTKPLPTRIKFPSNCVGMPKRFSVSDTAAAMPCIRPWITGASIGVTHGTATKMNATGKAKWRRQEMPPRNHIYKRVRVTAAAACSQPSGRQSGFPISNNRSGRSNNKQQTAAAAAEIPI